MTNVRRYLLIFLALVLIVLAWIYLKKIIIYLSIAGIISLIAQPLLRRLERIRIRKKKIPRSLRSLTVLLLLYVVIGILVAVFIPLILDEIKIMSNIDKEQLSTAMHEPLTQLQSAFSSMQSSGSQQTLEQFVQEQISSLIGFAQVSTIANGIVSIISNLFVAFFIISFFSFFFMKDGPIIFETIMLTVPRRHDGAVRRIVNDTRVLLTKYFTGVLLDILFVSTFVTVGMLILGVKNAIIIGLFAGVMNIIPYVGPLIGGAFAIAVGLSGNLTLDFYTGMLPLAGKISLVFVLMNLTDGMFVQPTIFSNSVKAHPLEIFLVILVAGTLAGIGGMIIAVPVYTILRVIAREFLSKYKVVQKLTEDLDNVTNPEPEKSNEFPET